jgi:hypothetical protein
MRLAFSAVEVAVDLENNPPSRLDGLLDPEHCSHF